MLLSFPAAQMKRSVREVLTCLFSASPKKRPRTEDVDDRRQSRLSHHNDPEDLHAHLDAIERLQSRLLFLDKECTNEQLVVQRKFDNMKKPIWEERCEFFKKIPKFWSVAIGNHPLVIDQKVFIKEDAPILAHLVDIQLDDNIDDNGSYELLFKFDQSRNHFFSESQISRKTIINDQGKIEVKISRISWAPKKKPKSKKSFFNWLSSEDVMDNNGVDVGDIFRTDLWQNPYPYYLNLSPGEYSWELERKPSNQDDVN